MQKKSYVTNATMLISIALILVMAIVCFITGRAVGIYQAQPWNMKVWVDESQHLIYLEDADGDQSVHFWQVIPDQSANAG